MSKKTLRGRVARLKSRKKRAKPLEKRMLAFETLEDRRVLTVDVGFGYWEPVDENVDPQNETVRLLSFSRNETVGSLSMVRRQQPSMIKMSLKRLARTTIRTFASASFLTTECRSKLWITSAPW